MAIHKCNFLVVSCIDFRFQKAITEWLKRKKLLGNCDRLSIAGGVKDLELLLATVKISLQLHQIKEVILINHEDCGAYGPNVSKDKKKELEIHRRDLERAEKLISKKHPDIGVKKYFLTLDFMFSPL